MRLLHQHVRYRLLLARTTCYRGRAGGYFLLCGLLFSFFLGCSSSPSKPLPESPDEAVQAMVWDYEESAIYINLESEGLLNFYNNEPHTLILGVIQLSEPKGFTKLLKSPEVIKQILETGKVEEPILQFDRFVVTPGNRSSLLIDRAQDTKVVGVVAGYFNFDAIKPNHQGRRGFFHNL